MWALTSGSPRPVEYPENTLRKLCASRIKITDGQDNYSSTEQSYRLSPNLPSRPRVEGNTFISFILFVLLCWRIKIYTNKIQQRANEELIMQAISVANTLLQFNGKFSVLNSLFSGSQEAGLRFHNTVVPWDPAGNVSRLPGEGWNWFCW